MQISVTIDRKLLFFFGFVVMIHFVSFWKEISTVSFSTLEPVSETEIEIVPMTADEWKAFKTKNQIVQTDDAGKKEKPKDKAFLGETDKTYDRQTVASSIDKFNSAAKGNSSVDTQAQQASKSQKKALKDLKLSDIGAQDLGSPKVQRAPASFSKKGLENGDERSQGLSSTNDYIEDVALGDFTQLNTVEYKYYGFYNRIRGKLEQYWGLSLREKADKIFKSGRSLASSDQYITSLVITMNKLGEIVHVKVKGSSGVKELDDAAIDSFRSAGPFPNPPQGMLVNGHATIEWGFVVKS
jgi:TonB family protein